MARYVKIYITPDDISRKLAEPDRNKQVVFTKAEVCADGTIEFTGIVLDDLITDDNPPRRYRYSLGAIGK